MNMGDFGEWVHVKKTRKPYQCIFCGRIITAGNKGYGFQGKWQGDWQNWKCCVSCEDHVLPVTEPGEALDHEDFNTYLEDSGYRYCENGCKPDRYENLCSYVWSEDKQSLIFTCKKCGNVRIVPYPYTESEADHAD